MCGRYYIGSEEDQQEIREILTELNRRYHDRPVLNQLASGEIFPTQNAPVIVHDPEQHEVRAAIMSWGFPAPGAKRQSIINARCETADSKPMFRKAVEQGRLIVPATAYFEWQKHDDGSKTKQRISPADGEMLRMAGLWRVFTDPHGDRLISFVIITRPANDSLAYIHDRMPLILNQTESAAWLEDSDYARQLLTNPPDPDLAAVAVI
ncbi:MAG: SOS response-associated peptidase [Clostridiaceae bacterium]|nr:SOS response-associated peptidase [Clostridiaceae bacterium]